MKLPKGTVVTMEAIYDNSPGNPDNPNNPPKRVFRGEQTTDEMCLCFLQLTVDDWFLGSRNSLTTGLEILRWYRDANRASTQAGVK